MNPREAFFQALSALKNGHIHEAEDLCKQLLRLNPNDINSLRLYGQIASKKGDLREAEKAYLRTLNLAPDYAHAYMDLGALYKSQGDLKKAQQHLTKAIDLDQRLHAAKRILFDVYEAQGETQKAAELSNQFEKRGEISEKIKYAYQLHRDKKHQELEEACQAILQQDPGNLAALSLLAEHTVSERQAIRASHLFQSVIDRMPDNWRAWNGLARAKVIQDHISEGIKCLNRSLEIEPDAIETKVLKADAYTRQYDYTKAIEELELALQQQPDHNPALAQLGLALKTIGEQDRAIEVLRQCIANDELYGEAYWTLSDMKTFKFSDEEVAQMDRIFTSEQLNDSRQVQFGYALGKAMEHRKDYQRAFQCYEKANTVQKQILDYSALDNTQFTDQIIQAFTPELIQRLQSSVTGSNTRPDITPIFIVGLPRSGSTLQEQILASHSQVEGTQELPYMPRLAKGMNIGKAALTEQPFPASMNELTTEQVEDIAQRYLTLSEHHRTQGKSYFIDKLPNNFSYIGLIALCFPNAKIINTIRHPMDNCLGCYKQLWAMGQHFTYDLEDLGHYYQDYHRLMQHWHSVLPGRILDVHYEQVVDDVENHVDRLLDFCGLEFEESCVQFHETKRAVKTSSSEQVRTPIYRSALDYWKNFEEELKPLKAVLGELAED